MALSPNLGLSILVPGSSSGPGWATSLESDKLIIDAHTHVSGQGLQVPTAGLNINATLPFNTYGASSVGTIGLAGQTTTASGTSNIFYRSTAGDIYWNNASGVPIQLTTGNAINVASVGGITGLGGTTGAFTYSDALKTFIATADTAKSAAIDAGAYTVRETNVANAKGVTIKSPSSLSADYNMTLPATVPTVSGVMVMDTSGTVGTGILYIDPTSGKWTTKTTGTGSFPIYMAVSNTTSTGAINNVAKIIAGGVTTSPGAPASNFKVPANTLRVGSTLRFTIQGNCTSSNADATTLVVKAGSAGTTADTSVASFSTFNSAGSGTTVPFIMRILMTINTIGAAAVSNVPSVEILNGATNGLIASVTSCAIVNSTATFDSTAALFFSVALATGSATTTTVTVLQATAELI